MSLFGVPIQAVVVDMQDWLRKEPGELLGAVGKLMRQPPHAKARAQAARILRLFEAHVASPGFGPPEKLAHYRTQAVGLRAEFMLLRAGADGDASLSMLAAAMTRVLVLGEARGAAVVIAAAATSIFAGFVHRRAHGRAHWHRRPAA